MEKIYPRNIISNKLYKRGDEVSVSLDGFETAIFSFHPIDETDKPLISGVDFIPQDDGSYIVVPTDAKIDVLQKNKIDKVEYEGKNLSVSDLIDKIKKVKTNEKSSASVKNITKNQFSISTKFNPQTEYGEIAILFMPDNINGNPDLPEISVLSGGKKVKTKEESEKGKWKWIVAKVDKNASLLKVSVSNEKNTTGEMKFYLITYEKPDGVKIKITNEKKSGKVYPPRPLPNGLIKKEILIKQIKI